MARRQTSRSSTGCATCKIRRIKCDESRPVCTRCTSTGRKCDGYPAQPTHQLTMYNNRTQAQYQAFDFFVVRVLPGMSRVVDTEFWERSLLQVSQTDSSVWLAATAMSELVRELQPGYTGRKHAIEWYARSISELQKRVKAENKWSVACSVTAILYICIECLLENMMGALSIGQQAMQQIVCVKDDTISTSIMPLLKHMTLVHGLTIPENLGIVSQIPVMDVQDLFYGLVVEAHQFVCYAEELRKELPKDSRHSDLMYQHRDTLLTKLKRWPEFELPPKYQEKLPWSCMQLVRLNYIIWVSVILDTEMAFDEHLDDFEQMLRYASIAIDATSDQLFSFETRVIPPLGYVATRCRHPHIRRKAIKMLECGPQIENTRHAKATIAVAKRILAVEESGRAPGVYKEEPISEDFPPSSNRLIYAKVEPRLNNFGQMQQHLVFARWRLRDNAWVEDFQVTPI